MKTKINKDLIEREKAKFNIELCDLIMKVQNKELHTTDIIDCLLEKSKRLLKSVKK